MYILLTVSVLSLVIGFLLGRWSYRRSEDRELEDFRNSLGWEFDTDYLRAMIEHADLDTEH